ncbi:methyl-CpG-binding domain protein 2-like isoform X2 [Lytechinus variegatus]|uniref:methyl-CpG-binding domain protein 2-like isoform X2 n=1 Tax=Lytechinus variegatus TaxID=7654 RepID=UPI001BB127DC|nr:methyl-CpG-binding domain protein 2-like isoform X2 [Lytechinus variegatus]
MIPVEKNMDSEERIDTKGLQDCPGLPTGWKREEVIRKSGLSAGKTDVYYYSPCGKKMRSKPQLARFIGDAIDLSAFDFRTGKLLSSGVRKSKRLKNIHFDYSRGTKHDASLVLPIRQTASIFKQPVTLKTNHIKNRTKADPKQDTKETPKQLFWEKRLQGLNACDMTEEILKSMELPDGLISVGPGLTNDNLLQSLASSLHLSSQPILGQVGSQPHLDKNPGVYLNADQPPCLKFMVTEADIRRQEERVKEVRDRLQRVMKGDPEAIQGLML